jgi:5,10-methylenetetrahydromethanopterin reductase
LNSGDGALGGKVGVSLSSFTDANSAVRCARLAEGAGFDGIWLPEHYGEGRDSIPLFAVMAVATARIRLGTAVTNPFGRNPFLIANALATLDELGGGRMVLGLGPGNPGRLKEFLAVDQEKPLEAVRGAIGEIRALWKGGFRVGLGYVPVRPSIPILVAAVHDGMLRLAGEIGDGVMFSKATPPEFVAGALKRVREGQRNSSLDPSLFEVAALITCIYDADEERAEFSARENTIDWLVRPKRGELLLGAIGEDMGLLRELRRLVKDEGRREAAKAIPIRVLEHFAVYGNVDSCLRGLERFRRAGVTTPILSTTLEGQEGLIRGFSRRLRSNA